MSSNRVSVLCQRHVETKMNDRTAPAILTETLDASLRDIADGALTSAADAQAEARRMLADYENAHPA